MTPRFSRFASGCWFALAVVLLSASPALAADSASDDAFFMQVVKNLFNVRGLMEIFKQPGFYIPAIIAINVIVFVETGLLIGFFLPGDSLLVTAGLVAHQCDWNIPLLLSTLCASAIIGDSLGYSIGLKTGPKIFNREKSFFFKKDHLLKAQAFYEKHGGKTIILARFMPIVRTFAPVVAGVGRMEYRRFIAFNVVGGIGWVCSMVLCGYFLPDLLNPLLQPVFGQAFQIEDHIEKVVIVVVLISIAPGGVMWLKSKLGGKNHVTPKQPKEEPHIAKLAG